MDGTACTTAGQVCNYTLQTCTCEMGGGGRLRFNCNPVGFDGGGFDGNFGRDGGGRRDGG
jgi:hypothetical protein